MKKPETKITSIRLDKDSHKKIKVLAAEYGLNVGEVIEGLLNFAKTEKSEVVHQLKAVGITDPNTHELIEGAFQQLFIDTMEKIEARRGGWTADGAAIEAEAKKRSEEE